MNPFAPRPVFIVDIIGDVVKAVEVALLAQLKAVDATITGINYLYGPPLEIYNTLAQMSGSLQYAKYPLVALYQPFDENQGTVTGIDSTTPLRIIIARASNATDKAKERYDKNFRPILYPIYSELLYQLGIERRIAVTTWQEIKRKKRDWPYWDNDGKNPLIDYVDIIEISGLELNFRLKNC
jgi:hypothetical protein